MGFAAKLLLLLIAASSRDAPQALKSLIPQTGFASCLLQPAVVERTSQREAAMESQGGREASDQEARMGPSCLTLRPQLTTSPQLRLLEGL
jgi:hypothetical protein